MPRKYRNEETVSRFRKKQKNGDIYVYEGRYRYDPESQKNKCLGTKLLGKIPKGATEMVPTRPKRPSKSAAQQKSENTPIEAERQCDTLDEILEWAGQASGVDGDVAGAMHIGDAQKTISIARYLLASGGQPIPGIENWQITHTVPYADGLSTDVCYRLFDVLGSDESARQSFFYERAARLGNHPLIAFDSTTISTYSELLPEARFGFNKDNDGLKTIKYLVLYAVDTMEPIAYAEQPGNLPDVTSLTSAVAQLKFWGTSKPQVVMDKGFFSEENVMELCRNNMDFLVLGNLRSSWIKPHVEACLDTIKLPTHLDDDPGTTTYVQTVKISHEFTYERKYASSRKGLAAGAKESFSRCLYLHVCYNPLSKEMEDTAFIQCVRSVMKDIQNGVMPEEMSDSGRRLAEKYLIIRRTRGGKIKSVEMDNDAIVEACRYHGIFVIVANHERNGFRALHKYRRREKVEEFFKREKQDVDGNTPRVWYHSHLLGRMLVQFVALCYDDFLRRRIHIVRTYLDDVQSRGFPDQTAAQANLDKDLLKWLNKLSFHQILTWFDVYESIRVRTPMNRKRWDEASTRRDRRFLELLKDMTLT